MPPDLRVVRPGGADVRRIAFRKNGDPVNTEIRHEARALRAHPEDDARCLGTSPSDTPGEHDGHLGELHGPSERHLHRRPRCADSAVAGRGCPAPLVLKPGIDQTDGATSDTRSRGAGQVRQFSLQSRLPGRPFARVHAESIGHLQMCFGNRRVRLSHISGLRAEYASGEHGLRRVSK